MISCNTCSCGGSCVALDQESANAIIDGLRIGRPSIVGVHEYSVGGAGFLSAIERLHLQATKAGKIRFACGSWGAGKSHFLAQLNKLALDKNWLVSSVNLNSRETPFNRFEEVFYAIVRSISSADNSRGSLAQMFQRQIFGGASIDGTVDQNVCEDTCDKLMQNTDIDPDFRRIVCEFWRTYLPGVHDAEDRRAMIIDWFSGLGTIERYRRNFGVQKMVKSGTAGLILRSLVSYSIHAGFLGLLVLIDEAEMVFSTMRNSSRKRAHNNLLNLLNTIEDSRGLFVVFATTPDFFLDPNYGIIITGPLAQRIGGLPPDSPNALQPVWNLQKLQYGADDYVSAARKVRRIYICSYPESESVIADCELLDEFVTSLHQVSPPQGRIDFWRLLMRSVVGRFDMEFLEGAQVPTSEEFIDRFTDVSYDD